MPSTNRATRSSRTAPNALNSVAQSPLHPSPAPRHVPCMVRRPAATSRLAHWMASVILSRSGKLAKQAGPIRSRRVIAARAARVVTDSTRGLERRLSPTQKESNTWDSSAIRASSYISATLVEPKRIPRFGNPMPKRSWLDMSVSSSAGAGTFDLDAALGRLPRIQQHGGTASQHQSDLRAVWKLDRL